MITFIALLSFVLFPLTPPFRSPGPPPPFMAFRGPLSLIRAACKSAGGRLLTGTRAPPVATPLKKISPLLFPAAFYYPELGVGDPHKALPHSWWNVDRPYLVWVSSKVGVQGVETPAAVSYDTAFYNAPAHPTALTFFLTSLL